MAACWGLTRACWAMPNTIQHPQGEENTYRSDNKAKAHHPSWWALQSLLLQVLWLFQVLQWEKKSSQRRCTVLRSTCGWSKPCNESCNCFDLFDRPCSYSKPSDGPCRCHNPHDQSCGAVPPAGLNHMSPVNTFLYMPLPFQSLSLFLLWMEKKSSSAASTRPYQVLVWGLHLILFLHSWPRWEQPVLAVSWEYYLSFKFLL